MTNYPLKFNVKAKTCFIAPKKCDMSLFLPNVLLHCKDCKWCAGLIPANRKLKLICFYIDRRISNVTAKNSLKIPDSWEELYRLARETRIGAFEF